MSDVLLYHLVFRVIEHISCFNLLKQAEYFFVIAFEAESVESGFPGTFDIILPVIDEKAFLTLQTIFVQEGFIDLNIGLEHKII